MGRQIGGTKNPIRYFNTSPAGNRLAVMMVVRFPLLSRRLLRKAANCRPLPIILAMMIRAL